MVHVASGANEFEIRHPQLDAQLYVIRAQCIQHDSVFVAAIRPKPGN
jgi:hypothetical protein